MSKRAPIVAELGRPETPAETAERKAAATAAYRSSQTFRNLIAAMLVTLGVLAVIIFAVPRGSVAPPPPIDVAALAAEAATAMDRPVLVPEVGEGWQVNAAELEGGPTVVWDVTLAPTGDDERGFVKIAQAFASDAAWAPQRLAGTAPTGTVTLDGREWDEYVLRNPQQTANISYALGVQAGPDYVLVYGALSREDTAAFAEALSPQLDALTEAP